MFEMKVKPTVRQQMKYLDLCSKAEKKDSDSAMAMLGFRYELVETCYGLTKEEVMDMETERFEELIAPVERRLLDLGGRNSLFRAGAGATQAKERSPDAAAAGGEDR